MTCLDYAISMKHIKVIELLSKCGATQFQENILKDINADLKKNLLKCEEEAEGEGEDDLNCINGNDTIRKAIENALKKGMATLHFVRGTTEQTLYKTLPAFPRDICRLIVSYNGNIDLLQGMKHF